MDATKAGAIQEIMRVLKEEWVPLDYILPPSTRPGAYDAQGDPQQFFVGVYERAFGLAKVKSYRLTHAGLDVIASDPASRFQEGASVLVAPAVRAEDGLTYRMMSPSALKRTGVVITGVSLDRYTKMYATLRRMAASVQARFPDMDWIEPDSDDPGVMAARRRRERDAASYEAVMRQPYSTSPAAQMAAARKARIAAAKPPVVPRPAGYKVTTGPWLQVTPAYGRDYRTAVEAKSSWYSGQDWIVQDVGSRWDGKPINMKQAQEGNFRVILRFNGMQKTASVV